ncbi:unnamed protein product [Bursaphelenchus xylophilus]|uniref:(pine wood nematode) hypothetical protein n=1 Tax=Bursaphelenchus xylophilus TaxID=6326 RepID=A0A1I7RMC4_BURXY|nr:unnamed protein product [Bursaphelenchus xylophilus]CAG9118373.1 unnamed protein product [Bursaphelenchus xylophilus]
MINVPRFIFRVMKRKPDISVMFVLLLVGLVSADSKGFSLLRMSPEPRMCKEFLCDDKSVTTETLSTVLTNGGEQQQCRDCRDCTDSGYSVCIQRRTPGCHCGHAVPNGCSAATRGQTDNAGFELVRLCYMNALRTPPKPSATNEKKDVIVTIQPFWLDKYWKGLKLDNLTLFYEFEVKSPENCDGRVTTINKGSKIIGYLCTPHLQIDLEEEPEAADRATEYDESSLAPEIQFERAVFDEATEVRFYYRVNAKRERQLNLRNQLVDRPRLIESDRLNFDLTTDPEDNAERKLPDKIVKTTTTTTTTTTPTPTTTVAVNKVKIQDIPDHSQPKANKIEEVPKMESKSEENKPQPTPAPAAGTPSDFLEEHLNNGGQLNLILYVGLATLIVCVLIVLLTCCLRRHRMAYKKTNGAAKATKQHNGYEYKQTAQEA